MIYVVIGILTLILLAIVVIRALRSGDKDNLIMHCAVMGGACLVSMLMALIANSSVAKVPEMLHYQYKTMTYYEPWDEYIHKTCSKSHERCSGSGEKRTCTTYYTYYDCSYVDNHPARWESDHGSVNESMYLTAVGLWGNKKFVDMNRRYHSYDGDAYTTAMPDSANQPFSPRVLGFSTQGSYENKVVFSKSVFKFKEVTPEEVKAYGLYAWGESPLMGVSDTYADMILRNTNYLYGASRQMSLRVMVFRNKGIESAFWQESYWNGGNKNEFNVCIGVDADNNISWVKVISWTTNEVLKLEVRDAIIEMNTFQIHAIVRYLAKYVPPRFVRREFKEFSYLPDPPTGMWVYVVSIIIMIGAFIGTFFINTNPKSRYRYY